MKVTSNGGGRGMTFKFLAGDCNWREHGGKFISAKRNNGDWDYWLVMEVINLGTIEDNGREYTEYNVSVSAVSPEAAGEENYQKALQSMSFEAEQLEQDWTKTSEFKVEVLSNYGIFAQLWSENGNNLRKLMRKARRDIKAICGLFGFAMDEVQNKLGSNGWDFIEGNPTAGLDRYRESLTDK